MIKTLMIGCFAAILCGCTLTTYTYVPESRSVYKVRTGHKHYHTARHKHFYKKKRRTAIIRHRHPFSSRPYYLHTH